MSASMSPTALFQHYIQKIFKFPKEIKHDIVYCQRALKAHIKVHQMVLDVYKTQLNPDPVQKKRIIDELESQIYEINAEQQFLLLRLRRVIDEFYKTISRRGVTIIPELLNDVVSSELVPLINDQSFLIYPISVRFRSSEKKLIEKYFEVKHENENENNCFEVLDSDEEEQHKMAALSKANPKPNYKNNYNNILPDTGHKNLGNHEQVSLLKPMPQRVLEKEQQNVTDKNETFIDVSQFVEVMDDGATENLKEFEPPAAVRKRKRESDTVYPVSIQESKSVLDRENDNLAVSKNVKMSRLNLRQALKKAHTETLAAKAAANVGSNHSQNGLATSALPRSKSATDLLVNKKVEQRTRTSRGLGSTTINDGPTKPIELNSSSGDSTPERSLTPQQGTFSGPPEHVDMRIKPDDYGQEMFLRIFGLYTPEIRLQMQQRRSKRKRRTVQSNERSDFHYGRIEYGSFPPPEDKKNRKTFLLSPQVKRKQGRPPKRRSPEKSDDTSSRSNSSSPDEKRGCNECIKGGGSLERCEGCKGFYHQSCHREVDDKGSKNSKNDIYLNKTKICPACKRYQARLKCETEQHKSLQTTAKKLEKQMITEKTRNKNLHEESESFKVQMSTLYNIVNAMKSDPANNSD